MSANIFHSRNRVDIIDRLQALSPADERRWGTMTQAEMLRHCRAQLDFILNPPANPVVHATLFSLAPVRWMALYGPRWPRNSPTAPELDVRKKLTDVAEVETEKAKLRDALTRLVLMDDVKGVHPLFGSLGKKDWGRLVWKHLDHHLRQFGR